LSKVSTPSYVGRFAPTPSGELHFGSLITAIASFLDAKANHGQWLLRIDDVDTTRARKASIDSILSALDVHQLTPDLPPYFQSDHYDEYQHQLELLLKNGLGFYCNCTRARLKPFSHQYDGHCIHHAPEHTDNCAIRLTPTSKKESLTDLLQGELTWEPPKNPHPILKRRDGCFGYPLSMVIDDHIQGVTHVIRGRDLLDETPTQLHIQRILGVASPTYAHIGTAVMNDGRKLSKQNKAPAINLESPCANIRLALAWLNQPAPPSPLNTPSELLAFAVTHWQLLACETGDKLAP